MSSAGYLLFLLTLVGIAEASLAVKEQVQPAQVEIRQPCRLNAEDIFPADLPRTDAEGESMYLQNGSMVRYTSYNAELILASGQNGCYMVRHRPDITGDPADAEVTNRQHLLLSLVN